MATTHGSGSSAQRVVLTERPFAHYKGEGWNSRGQWPGQWIAIETPKAPFIAAYRHSFTVDAKSTIRVHVTADERYELFLDGALVGRGSERGDVMNWFFETYDIDLEPGDHFLTARVWTFGDEGPVAQLTKRHGFLCVADDEKFAPLVSTGTAKWEGKVLPGYVFTTASQAWGVGANLDIHGDAFDWNWLSPTGGTWEPANSIELAVSNVGVNDLTIGHHLRPGSLPSMISRTWTGAKVRHCSPFSGTETSKVPIRAAESISAEVNGWQALADGGKILIPAHTTQRVLIDMNNYATVYHHLTTSGGAGSSVRIHWQEALFLKPEAPDKGNRDEIEGKYFTTIWNWHDGIGDMFRPDGGQNRAFSGVWWHSGRYVEILVSTADEPLTIEGLRFEESRYPFENEAKFEASDPRLATVIPIAHRTLQMCSHETYMDCPFYEQLQYVGDSRLQVLVTYITSSDDRLPRKALDMLNVSRLTTGLTQSRYPSRILQIIPPFSLWWVAMVHDFALWRGDMDYVRKQMPGVRDVLEYFRTLVNADNHLTAPDGWNFIDWVPGWDSGMAPGADKGVSGILNLHFALTLRFAAELETWMGEHELASRNTALANRIMKGAEAFFDPDHGLYADDLAKTSWSEHAQCLALLEGTTPHTKRLVHGLIGPDAPELSRTTIYFTHYLFEVYGKLGRTDLILDRMKLWFDHPGNGMKTTIEMPEPTRSDCHAWGAHPVYHYFATILGIRPVKPGLKEVRIHPVLGPMKSASGSLKTPQGVLEVAVDGSVVQVVVPEGMSVHIGDKTFGPGRHQASV